MTVKVPLRVTGLDLRDATSYERIPAGLADLSFEATGGVSLVVVYTDAANPVAAAADAARSIGQLMPGVVVAEAHDELLSVSDIAARCEVAAEAARLWAVGKRRASLRPFPGPRQVVGSGSGGRSMSLYAWREVLSWVRATIGTDPDEGITYLGDRQYAELNAEIAGLDGVAGRSAQDWHQLNAARAHVTAPVQQMVIGSAAGGILRRSTELPADEGARACAGTLPLSLG